MTVETVVVSGWVKKEVVVAAAGNAFGWMKGEASASDEREMMITARRRSKLSIVITFEGEIVREVQ